MGMLRVTLPKCVYIHIHRHVFHLSQDLSVWLGLTSREQLMSPEWSKHQVLSFSIYIAMYFIYIYIYIYTLMSHTDKSWEGRNTCLCIYALNLFIEHSGEHWREQNVFSSFTTPQAFWQSSAPGALSILVTSVLLY